MTTVSYLVLIILASNVASNTTQFEGTGIGVLTAADYALLVGYAILMLAVCALAGRIRTSAIRMARPMFG